MTILETTNTGTFTFLRQLRPVSRVAVALIALGAVWPLVIAADTEANSSTSQDAPRVLHNASRGERPRALLVGGGPTADHNQVAIESNVRYLLKLLPNDAERTPVSLRPRDRGLPFR